MRTNRTSSKPVAPFGYTWQRGLLVIDDEEAAVIRLIFELFVRQQRKKTVARLANKAGYTTRLGAMFSDTNIERILRDQSSMGVANRESGEWTVAPIISSELWHNANAILDQGARRTRTVNPLFSGITRCSCGGKMEHRAAPKKYVCSECRHKIPVNDLESVFVTWLASFDEKLGMEWDTGFSETEKREIIEQICEQIVVGRDEVNFLTFISPDSFKALTEEEQRPAPLTPTFHIASPTHHEDGPLLSEAEAAAFLGVSKMTVIRKRNAGELKFFRVGFRVLYSKTKHLQPFLERRDGNAKLV